MYKEIEKMIKKDLKIEFKKRKMKFRAKQTLEEIRERLKKKTGSQLKIIF